jgi:hypothetical protein
MRKAFSYKSNRWKLPLPGSSVQNAAKHSHLTDEKKRWNGYFEPETSYFCLTDKVIVDGFSAEVEEAMIMSMLSGSRISGKDRLKTITYSYTIVWR